MVETSAGRYIRRRNKKALNAMQHKFCELYFACGNATEAAKAAGYAEKSSKVSGSSLMRNPLVQAYLRKRSAQQVKKHVKEEIGNFNAFDWKVGKLTEIIEKVSQDINEMECTPADSIRAISELNKMCGDHAAEKRVIQSINVNIDAHLKEAKELMNNLLEIRRKEY